MNNPQNPSWTAFAVTTTRRLSLVIKALITGMLCMVGQVNAQVPDLTAGELPVNPGVWINLGPTGVQAWVYRGIEGGPTSDTGLSRQFQVKTIEAGSPAAGILAVDDVILGADGTGATPVPFALDARKSFAYAIGDAEASTPATLKLLVWRAGTTSTMTLTLRTMGAYSPTAPFNCPKSAKILDEGLDYAMANQDAGYVGISALALMAANNPADPKNAARQARAQTYALAQMLSPGVIQYINDGNVETSGSLGWDRGLRLVVLAEYYLMTGDTQVLPSIEAIALSIAQGQGANGAVGHIFNTSIKDGVYNEPFSRGYTMNASTLPTALGLVLARKCGVTLPELDPAIERVTRTLAGTANIGSFDYYVEGEPNSMGNEDNGKSSLGAIVFAMHNDRVKEAKFMANLAVGGAYSREDGHITHYFNLLWAPLGCQVGGQAAAVAHFNEIRWLMDLNRHWDGDFEYERDNWFGPANTPAFANGGRNFHMSTAALLTYAMPLQQLEITGKTFATRPELVLGNSEIAAAALSNAYDATGRTTAELMQDLLFELTRTQYLASMELAARPADAAAQVPTLIARVADPSSPGRTGACRALGEIRDDAAVPTLLALLNDADNAIRYRAAEALTKFPVALLRGNINFLLQAAITNAKPAFPLDFNDPQQFAQLKLSEVIFGFYGTGGAINNDLTSIDRALLYPAIRVFAAHPHSKARNRVAALYNKLTPADVTMLSDVLIAGVNFFGVSNVTPTPGLEAIKVLERDDWAEGIPLTKDYFINSRFKNIDDGLTELQDYGTAALTVTPDPQVIDFLNSMLSGEYESRTDNGYNAQITAIRDALLAASNPPVLPSFKSIQSVTASPAVLTLPSKQTQLNVSFTDLSQGDTVFSWRKVHGPGAVTFTTNNTVGSIAPQVYFDGVPGLYLFEVKAWDSRKLTEVTGTVQVELRNSGGGLPANSPPSASAQSVTVPQAIATPITLTGTDPESYPFAAFEVLGGPGNGTLGGTPPFLTYTSGFNFTGADSLSFRVMDSNGQWSAPATVSITVATRVNSVGLLVYEPVDYATGPLNGKSGGSEIGLLGTWLANSNVQVQATSLAYGSLPTSGGKMDFVRDGSRPINASVLAGNGLLNDGASLWFSTEVGYGISADGGLRFALANNKFVFPTGAIEDEGAQKGQGVGFYLAGGPLYAATFYDPSQSDVSSMKTGELQANSGLVVDSNRLVVGKITWGADEDLIQIYLPTTGMALGEPVTQVRTVVNQSTFDTLTFTCGGTTGSGIFLDEIRFGATQESVLLGTVAMPADSTPPSPNPMTFAVAPSLATPTSATMQAATAFDANYGVEYYFTCTSGGGHHSGWQSSPVYTDTGLTPGVSYSYTVKARDLSPALNETAPSAAFSVGTPTATVVPALVDLPQAQAEALITGAGLVVGTVTTASSPTTEAGDVASQSPSGGASAVPGSAVNLVVSSTVQMTTVPNVGGQTQAAATSSLAAANLTPGTVLTDYSETIAAGVVMSQNPSSGSSLPRSSPVELVVSAGSAAGLAPLTQVLLEDFESPDVNSAVIVSSTVGGVLPSNGNWGASTGSLSAGKGIIDKASGAFTALDPNHQAFAIRSTDAGIVSAYNKIGTITAGTKYTVAVDIVKDSGQNNGTLADFQLKSFDQTATASTNRDATTEGTVILSRSSTAPVDGTFKTVTFEYVATNTNPYLGKDLAVRIAGGASAANMDNVRVWTSGARLADTAAPWVLSKAPADDSTAVVGNSDLTLNFSESVKAGNGYVTLKNLTNGSQRLISITDTRQVSFSGSTLTINPERNLLGLSDYAVLIGYDAVRDLAGNPFEGVSDPAAWNFSTGASSDSTAPTLISITDDQGGSAVVTGALVTYTVTFSEDMDADSVIASDFGNAGSSALKFMGVTEVSPGVFTVSVIPTSLGTLQLRINAGSALTDASGNALNTSGALADDTVITVNLGIMAPVWSGNPVVGTNATEDSVYSSTLLNYATDANGDPLTFTKISGPTWLSVATNGNLSGTLTNSNVGLNTFVVSMTDGNTAPVQATLNISVINTNDAPTFTQNPVYTPPATRYAAYASSIASYAGDIDVGATLVFAKTGGPAWLNVAANGDISGTPSTGDLGTNTFTVTVSDGIAAPVSATLLIKVNATEPAVPAIYEPFAASDPSLLGNTPGTGLIGTWAGSTAVAVTSPSFFYGALPSIGGKVVQPYGNASSVATGNSLLDAGLLANGNTLWFSFLQKAGDGSSANDESAFALGSTPLTSSLGTPMLGTGIGLSWKSGEGFQGSYWNVTKVLTATKAGASSEVPTLVVASITWGADDTANETLSIYLPDRSIAMPASPALVYTIPARAQSTFQTLSFVSRSTDGKSGLFDEFRFGSSYDSVTGQAQITGDGTPPTLAVSAIVDDRGGATVATGSVVTYTMTFSEDMNAATVGADDFSNAGSAAMTIGSIVETSPGVFTVQATPTTGGTLRPQVAAGAILADMGGNLLDTSAGIPDDTTINVVADNSAPVWTGNPVNEVDATKNVAYASTLADDASDANGNPLTFAKVSGPAWLSVASNGNISGTPGNSDAGANVFTVSVTDGIIATPVEANLNITVINTNVPPVWLSNPITGNVAIRDTAYADSIAGSASDADNNPLAFAKVSGPAWLSVASDGSLSGMPNNSDVGANSFTVSVTDGIAAPVQATINIQVNAPAPSTAVIHEPFADGDSTLSGNTPGTGLVGTWATSGTTWNVSSPGLTYGSLPTSGNRVSNSPRGAHSITTGTVTNNSLLNAALLNHGQTLWFSFLWKMDDVAVSNGDAAFAFGTDSLSGGSNGGMPMLNTGSGIGVSMATYNGTLTAGSWTGGVKAAGSPAATWGSRTVAKLIVGKITWGVDGLANDVIEIYSPGTDLTLPGSPVSSRSAVLDQSQFDTVSFATKTEGDPQIDEIRFGASYAYVVGASGGGDTTPPTLIGTNIVDNQSGAPVTVGTLVTYTVTFSEDINSSTVSAADFGNTGSAAVTIGTITETSPGVFTVQATPTTSGTLQLRVNAGAVIADVSGNALNTASAIADNTTITVNSVNVAPVWASNPVNEVDATEDVVYISSLADNANDANGDPLTFSKVSGPAWLSVASDGSLSGTPSNDDVGAYSFTVSVTDGIATAVTATLNITVINTNDAPVFAADPIDGGEATEGAAYSGTLAGSASDDDGDLLTYAKVGGPAWLVVAADGTLSGTPSNADVGATPCTVSVTDGIAAPVQATLNIQVNASDPSSAVIHEPFADGDSTLSGNTPGTGLVGTWATSGTTWNVSSPGLTYGSLPTSGNRASNSPRGANSITTGTVSNNSLLNAGLLNHGQTLWFSFLWKMDDVAVSNGDAAFVLGTDSLSGGSNNGMPMLNTGSGIGVSMGTYNGTLTAGSWTGGLRAAGSLAASWGDRTVAKLIVGKITWGVDGSANDVIEIYSPGTDLALPGATVSSKSAVLDQSQFDTVSFATKTEGDPQIDEIRFGLSYESVIGASGGGDTTPPTLVGANIVDDQSGAPVTVGTLVTYTVTFSEDIDDTTVTAADFGNAGTSSITIGTITESVPGVFSLQVTPTTSGTLQLWVNAGAVITDVSGNALNTASAIADDTTITVNSVNVAPVWASNPVNEVDAIEDSAYAVTLADNASDANGDPLTFAKVSGPAWLSVASDGSLSGTPTNSDVGADSFTVSVSDGIANAVTATLNITVINTNDAPTWAANPIAGGNATEDVVYSGTLAGSASDVDAGATLVFAKVSGPAWLSIAPNGTVSGTPANSDVGANSFIVSVGDGIATPVDSTLNITVINTNDAPTWASNPVNGPDATEDSVYSASLASGASDVDAGASLTFAKVSGPAWLSIAANGALSGTPSNSNVGANSFTVSVSDGIATEVTETLEITVTNTNDAPTWVATPIAGADATEDAVYSGSIAGSATDVDAGASLTYAKVSGPAWLSIAPNGALSGTPSNSNVGANSFTVSVSDGIVTEVTATLEITVTNTNDAPTWVATPIAGADATEDAVSTGSIAGSASDVDPGATLTFAKVSGPAWLSIAPNGALSGTPTNTDVGANSFTVSVSDGIAAAVPTSLNLTVINTNDAPVFTADPIVAAGGTEGVAYTGQTIAGSAIDADAGDSITYSKVSGPAWLAVAANGALYGTPPSGSSGLNSFVVRATDSASATDDATLQITVTGLPLPWVAADIGTGMLAGSTTFSGGTFTQAGSGIIGSTSDKLRFTYQTLTGDGEIIARISNLENTGNSSRVGVMIRDTLAANSKQIFMGITGSNAYRWVRRTTTGGSASSSNSSTGTVPNTWVRLVRSNTTITAYKSTNGTTWTTVGSTTNTTFATTCYIGLAVGSGSDTTLNTSQYSNVSVTP